MHFLVPGGRRLSRGAFTMADVAAEELHKRDPGAAAQQVQDKYIKGLQVRRPAVVSVNMFAAALAVNDFLARVHPYRTRPNSDVASIEFSLAELRLTQDEEEDCPILAQYVGLGDLNSMAWASGPGGYEGDQDMAYPRPGALAPGAGMASSTGPTAWLWSKVDSPRTSTPSGSTS